MTTVRKEYSATDASPTVLYAKTDTDSQLAYPVTPGMMSGSMTLPEYDSLVVNITNLNSIVLTYKLSGNTVATKTIVTAGTIITISKS